MKLLNRINKKYLNYLWLLALIFVKADCVLTPFTVIQPASAPAGSVLNVNLTVNLKNANVSGSELGKRLIIAFLAPKAWDAQKNTTLTYVSGIGSGTFVKIPDGTKIVNNQGVDQHPGFTYQTWFKNQLGAANNAVDEHEWVVFWTDKAYDFPAQQSATVNISLKTKLGTETMLTKLAYIATFSGDPAPVNPYPGAQAESSKVYYSDCFSITGGEGDGIDYCNKPLVALTPTNSLDNDLMTLVFDNDLFQTSVSNSQNIYLFAKAYTSTGKVIDKQQVSPETQLKDIGTKKYRLLIYPRGYFNIQPDETLTKMEYYIADDQGNKVGFGNTASPFVFTFKCK